MDVSFIPGIKCVLIGDHEVGKVRAAPDQSTAPARQAYGLIPPFDAQTSLISAYGTHEPLNPLLPGITEPIQIHVEHLYKLYLLSIHDTEGVHPHQESLSTSGSDSPPASLGLPLSSSQRSVQVVRSSDDIVTTRRIEYGLANVILICFSLVDRWSFEHIAEVWRNEIHQLCPHIPFIVVGTKLDLRRPDPTTPQPQVRSHPFSRFTFRRPTIARSNTTSSYTSEEKRKKKVKASSEIDQHQGASQITHPLFSNRERPPATTHKSWYKEKCKDSISPTINPKLHRASLAIDDHPPNPPVLPPASVSPARPSLQTAQLASLEPPTSNRPSSNVLSLDGVGRSLNTVDSSERERVASIPNLMAMALTPSLSAIFSDGRTEPPSPTTQPARPGRSRFRLALFHRHTTDTVTTTTTNEGRGSSSGRSVAFPGVPLTLAQLAISGGTVAFEREPLNQSQVRGSCTIPPPMSPIASVSSIGMPFLSSTPKSESNALDANPPSPLRPPKGQAKVDSIKLPRAPTPADGSRSSRSPETAPGASPRQEGDGDGGRSRSRTPQRSKRNSPISYSEAHALAHEIGASAYIECSALTLVNVIAVFEEAVKVAVERRTASSSTLHRNQRASLSISDQKDCMIG